ncbi:MAG TPA: carboxypeptidase-like regulatory domain-containing protein, partial [Jatrophihabitantaceae bacterium]
MSGQRRLPYRCLVVLAIVCLSASAAAQVGAGALTGIVSDQSGQPVPGATATASAVGTNLTHTVVTAADGGYSIQALSPGEYRVRIELTGFRPLTREGVEVATGQTVRLDLQVQLGGLNETVKVAGDAPLLQSATSGLGQVVDNKKIVALPLNGRSFISLAGLAPGVALPPASSLPRINGGRPRTNEYLFDGISVLQPEPGQVAFFPNIDAIQEFKIES